MIYDISQPVLSCKVYPGDRKPESRLVRNVDKDNYNLTEFSMCAHNGTHIDAPCHFIKGGKSIDMIPLYKFVGPAYVAEADGVLSAGDASLILNQANENGSGKKILIKGNAIVTEEAAKVFAEAKIDLIGTELTSVGPEDAPMAVHLILLSEEVVLLEGIRLSNINGGTYLLNCAPLNLESSDGSPCRAILTDIN